MDSLIVSERFGPTVQGEGPSVGRPAVFLRLGLCNLTCGAGEGATWACDTPYTWDWTGKLGVIQDRRRELERVGIEELAEWVDGFPEYVMLVISGGEPMIQAKRLDELVQRLGTNRRVEIETNGTLSPGDRLSRVHFNVSPKLPNSGNAWEDAIKPDVLRDLNERYAAFKFVVADEQDIEDVAKVVELADIPRYRVWAMPAGVDSGTLAAHTRAVVDRVIERGWNITPRLHVNIWEDERCR